MSKKYKEYKISNDIDLDIYDDEVSLLQYFILNTDRNKSSRHNDLVVLTKDEAVRVAHLILTTYKEMF